MASLHELTKQNTLQTGSHSFCEIAKKSAYDCFKKFGGCLLGTQEYIPNGNTK